MTHKCDFFTELRFYVNIKQFSMFIIPVGHDHQEYQQDLLILNALVIFKPEVYHLQMAEISVNICQM